MITVSSVSKKKKKDAQCGDKGNNMAILFTCIICHLSKRRLATIYRHHGPQSTTRRCFIAFLLMKKNATNWADGSRAVSLRNLTTSDQSETRDCTKEKGPPPRLIVPEHDAQELLSLGLLVFQGHDEVADAAAGAVVVHVLLDGRVEKRSWCEGQKGGGGLGEGGGAADIDTDRAEEVFAVGARRAVALQAVVVAPSGAHALPSVLLLAEAGL